MGKGFGQILLTKKIFGWPLSMWNEVHHYLSSEKNKTRSQMKYNDRPIRMTNICKLNAVLAWLWNNWNSHALLD